MLAAIAMIGWKYLLITMVFLLAPLIQSFILKKKIAHEGVRSSEEIKNYTGVAQEILFLRMFPLDMMMLIKY